MFREPKENWVRIKRSTNKGYDVIRFSRLIPPNTQPWASKDEHAMSNTPPTLV